MEQYQKRLKYYRKQNIKMMKKLFTYTFIYYTGLCPDLINIIEQYSNYFLNYKYIISDEDMILDGYIN